MQDIQQGPTVLVRVKTIWHKIYLGCYGFTILYALIYEVCNYTFHYSR